MTLGLFLDGALIVLVAVMIGFCVVLNNRLKVLKNNENEMGGMLAAFQAAAASAEKGVTEMKSAGEGLVRDLAAGTREGKALRDELDVILSSGQRLADRLEGSISGARRTMGSRAKEVTEPDETVLGSGVPPRRSALREEVRRRQGEPGPMRSPSQAAEGLLRALDGGR